MSDETILPTEPDERLSGLLGTVRWNRVDVVAKLADHHRKTGVADLGLLRILATYTIAIQALEDAEQCRW